MRKVLLLLSAFAIWLLLACYKDKSFRSPHQDLDKNSAGGVMPEQVLHSIWLLY